LKPGGIFTATFPLMGSRLVVLPSHLFYFSQKTIDYLAERNDWKITNARFYKRYFSFAYLLRRLLKNNKLTLLKFFDFIVPITTFGEIEVYLRKA
jgi:hypothetical protein